MSLLAMTLRTELSERDSNGVCQTVCNDSQVRNEISGECECEEINNNEWSSVGQFGSNSGAGYRIETD